MAKRLTETTKWRDVWFRNLEPQYKLLWLFILDNCTAAGIWDGDIQEAGFRIGFDLDAVETLEAMDGRVRILEDGKRWFIPKFMQFHYKSLSSRSNTHRKVIQELQKEGLWEWYCSYYKEFVKNQSVNVDEGEGRIQFAEYVRMSQDEYGKLVTRLGSKQAVDKCIEILDNYKGQSGRKYNSDYRAILNWVISEYDKRVKEGKIRVAPKVDMVECAYCKSMVPRAHLPHHQQEGICPKYKIAPAEVVIEVRREMEKLMGAFDADSQRQNDAEQSGVPSRRMAEPRC